MLDRRVDRLEEDVRRMDFKLDKLDDRLLGVEKSIARLEGKLDAMPSATQLWRMVIGTWIAGAGIVLVAMRLLA